VEGVQDRDVEGSSTETVGAGGKLHYQLINDGATKKNGKRLIYVIAGGTQGTDEVPSKDSPEREVDDSKHIDGGHKI
jgi:hypothetical protein